MKEKVIKTKQCKTCGEEKTLEEFYPYKESADGRLYSCKECSKKRAAEYRLKNIERARRKNKEKMSTPEWKEYQRKRHAEKRKDKNYLLKEKARHAVAWALKSGKIKKASECPICNSKEHIVGHHEDYNIPLDVIWLCKICHSNYHVGTTDEALIIRRFIKCAAGQLLLWCGEQGQLDLIKYNDCFVCHEEGKRCELINGVVWEWESGE